VTSALSPISPPIGIMWSLLIGPRRPLPVLPTRDPLVRRRPVSAFVVTPPMSQPSKIPIRPFGDAA